MGLRTFPIVDHDCSWSPPPKAHSPVDLNLALSMELRVESVEEPVVEHRLESVAEPVVERRVGLREQETGR